MFPNFTAMHLVDFVVTASLMLEGFIVGAPLMCRFDVSIPGKTRDTNILNI